MVKLFFTLVQLPALPFVARLATVPGLLATAGTPGVVPSMKPPNAAPDNAGVKTTLLVLAKVQPGGNVLSTMSAPAAGPAPVLFTLMA